MNERRFGPETFHEPSRDFGILPFWFLNGKLDPEEMRYQLGELREKGMQGVILHGRYGLEVPYIGETYLDRIALAVEEAKRLGLTTWIYDEMNWPSGTADKRVLRNRPDLAQRYIECLSFTIRGPWFMCLTGEDSRYLDFEKSDSGRGVRDRRGRARPGPHGQPLLQQGDAVGSPAGGVAALLRRREAG